MNFLIGLLLFGIVASLGQALFAMASGPDTSGRMVRSLTIRIGLSLVLFAALMLGWHFGLIQPQGMR
jgi:ABC-type nitrate/sulfonate/bicarbonate transport system substrate-binding protein